MIPVYEERMPRFFKVSSMLFEKETVLKNSSLAAPQPALEKRRDELSFKALRQRHWYRVTPRGVGDHLKRATKTFGMGGHPGLASLPALPALSGKSDCRIAGLVQKVLGLRISFGNFRL